MAVYRRKGGRRRRRRDAVAVRESSGRSERARQRERQPVRSDTTIHEWPEAGLVLFHGPADPEASVRVESGRIVELDGRSEDDFDSLDRFIARHAIDPEVAEEAMALPPLELARRLFDPHTDASSVRRLFGGLTPARLVDVVSELDVLEMMLSARKMRLRNRVANQAHVTNLRDHPALLAADAAEAALRGFAEVETTVGVAGLTPLNAVAVLIGSQVGRPGVLTQAAVEEGVNLRLAMKGLVSYAETLSVYGNEDRRSADCQSAAAWKAPSLEELAGCGHRMVTRNWLPKPGYATGTLPPVEG